jgi:hypothetical protein
MAFPLTHAMCGGRSLPASRALTPCFCFPKASALGYRISPALRAISVLGTRVKLPDVLHFKAATLQVLLNYSRQPGIHAIKHVLEYRELKSVAEHKPGEGRCFLIS